MEINLHKCTEKDLPTLQRISRQTFTDTYMALNRRDNMERYMEEAYNLEQLTAEINDPNTLYFFAKDGYKTVGYLKLNENESQCEIKDEISLEVERIYVLQEYQGKSIGKQMMQKAFEIAREKGKERVWLGVWEVNDKAVEFYHKNGFEEFGEHTFILGEDHQRDILMGFWLNK